MPTMLTEEIRTWSARAAGADALPGRHRPGRRGATTRASTGFRLTTSEEDGVAFEGAAERPVDWLPQTTLRHGIGTLVSDRSKEPGQRQWLAEQRIHDALIVPLQGLRLRGVLVALDRLGDTTTFTADDLALSDHARRSLRRGPDKARSWWTPAARGDPRCPDRAAQPRAAHGAHARGADRAQPTAASPRGSAAGPGPVQGGQRRAGAPRRGRAPAGGRRTTRAPARWTRRHRRPARRRRVRHPAPPPMDSAAREPWPSPNESPQHWPHRSTSPTPRSAPRSASASPSRS